HFAFEPFQFLLGLLNLPTGVVQLFSQLPGLLAFAVFHAIEGVLSLLGLMLELSEPLRQVAGSFARLGNLLGRLLALRLLRRSIWLPITLLTQLRQLPVQIVQLGLHPADVAEQTLTLRVGRRGLCSRLDIRLVLIELAEGAFQTADLLAQSQQLAPADLCGAVRLVCLFLEALFSLGGLLTQLIKETAQHVSAALDLPLSHQLRLDLRLGFGRRLLRPLRLGQGGASQDRQGRKANEQQEANHRNETNVCSRGCGVNSLSHVFSFP
ncbi:MAG TPA: hypothetical protein PLS24_06165, partial [Sedimentisphaerales bacterium]|nr:hypothetical protein [Sedimentisphaerales bacterium]